LFLFAVRDELLHPNAPQKVTDWIRKAPPWIEITTVAKVQPVHGLHRGEAEVIAFNYGENSVGENNLNRRRIRIHAFHFLGHLSLISSRTQKQLVSPVSFHRSLVALLMMLFQFLGRGGRRQTKSFRYVQPSPQSCFSLNTQHATRNTG